MPARITGLTTRLITVPLLRSWGAEAPENHVIVTELTTDDGGRGHGFSWTPTIGPQAVKALLDYDIAPFILGLEANPEIVWDQLWKRLHEAGGGGLTTIAMAGVDLALWDLKARQAGTSVTGLLGQRRESVEVYGSGVNLHYPLEQLVEQAQRWVAAGHHAVKIKVGKPELREDAERVAAVRQVIGPDRLLMIDANQRWDLAHTFRALDVLGEYGLEWLEEPIRADDLWAYRRLRKHSPVPIALGENVHTIYRFRDFIEAEAVDIIQPNIVRVGGITPFRRIVELARANSIRVAPHLLPELSGQLALTLAETVSVEDVEDASFEQLGILAGPSPVRINNSKGQSTLSSTGRPGLGFEFAGAPAPPLPAPPLPASETAALRVKETALSTATLDLTAITAAATAAAKVTAAATDAERAAWLTAVADALDANVTELVAIADSETSLGTVRLTGEVARTSGQLRLFANVITEGSYLEAVIDHADPASTPPKPDLRRILRPIGPVAVFSASNFPFAFSVAGGDTASALAVGCPVIVKAHSGHLRLSERTAEIVSEALAKAGAPEGIFALVSGREAGTALVQDPAIKAVGFTGSIPGGRALFDLAASRPEPIPFYGELGSLNPVVITADALAERGQQLAAGLAGSFTMGAGQFCTKPGLVFIPAGTDFASHLAEASKDKPTAAMLTERIAEAYPDGLRNVADQPGVAVVSGTVQQNSLADGAAPVVFSTSAANVLERPEELLEECFGPTTLLIEYANQEELSAALSKVPGSLTGTVHAEPGEDVSALVEQLSGLAGRVLFDGWPTGVAVNWAQQHGGPYPATTSLFTSVGATAVRRFQRPVAYQDAPETVLHPALRDANPLGIPRRVDGVLTLS